MGPRLWPPTVLQDVPKCSLLDLSFYLPVCLRTCLVVRLTAGASCALWAHKKTATERGPFCAWPLLQQGREGGGRKKRERGSLMNFWPEKENLGKLLEREREDFCMCGELVAFLVFGYGNGFRHGGDCRIADAHATDVAISFFFA